MTGHKNMFVPKPAGRAYSILHRSVQECNECNGWLVKAFALSIDNTVYTYQKGHLITTNTKSSTLIK